MFENMTKIQARAKILEITKEYYEVYHKSQGVTDDKEKERIVYASRIFDHQEIW